MTDQRNAENRRQFLREVDLWFSLSDGYLVKLYGACHVGQPFFVCERAIEGTLGGYLKQGKSIWEKWSCIYEAAKGLKHLHDHGIIHGDLKGNNIVMGAFTVMLCDFGFASLASSSPKQLTDTEINALGAIQWKAPECLLGSAPTFASDIYSFGMCIIEIITGRYPWGDTMPDSVVKLNVTKEKRLPPRPEDIDDDAWSMILHMCCFDPGQRVTIGTVASVAYEIVCRM
ncbi:hypothetical protein DVH05_011329 [Phytophthora capsici]|nr:hypothetical protein DVH05_011329 [Phytophthora capsici]